MNWYKGNLHMHSFWSDGHGFPEMIAHWFKERGYQFIAFTEHDRHQTGEKWISDDPETPEGKTLRQFDLIPKYIARFGSDWVRKRDANGFTEVRLRELAEYRHLLEEAGRFAIFTGEEVSSPWGPGDIDHQNWVNVYNLPHALGKQAIAPTSAQAIQHTCRAARDGMASLNHPNWHYNATPHAVAEAADLRFIEIHTALNSCNNNGDAHHPSVEHLWNLALTDRLRAHQGPLIYGLATDDSHAYDADHHLLGNWALPGRAWVMVRANELTQDKIFRALNEGNFHGSTGVLLRDVETSAGGIRLSIDAQPGVKYTTTFIGSSASAVGQMLHESQSLNPGYPFTGDELYVRAIVTSDRPHPNPHRPGETEKAWTQPVRPVSNKDHP